MFAAATYIESPMAYQRRYRLNLVKDASMLDAYLTIIVLIVTIVIVIVIVIV